MKNKKNFLILGLSFLFLFGSATYALYQWSSTDAQKTSVDVTVGDLTINYEAGADVTATNLLPTTNRDASGKSIKKDITVSNSTDINANLTMYLDVTSIATELKHSSFKWEVMQGSTSVGSGNFSGVSAGDSITIINKKPISSTDVKYTLYVWIDGSVANPTNMANKTFSFTLRARADENVPTS